MSYHSKYSIYHFQAFNPKTDLNQFDYATFLAKWASRVKHRRYQLRDWKVFVVVPENDQIAIIYDRGQSDKNHIEVLRPEDCEISMKRPEPDPAFSKNIHPDEEAYIQLIPNDPNWNKSEDNINRYH